MATHWLSLYRPTRWRPTPSAPLRCAYLLPTCDKRRIRKSPPPKAGRFRLWGGHPSCRRAISAGYEKAPLKRRGFFVLRGSAYLTASLSALAAWNFGTRIEGTCTVAHVRGLRAARAALIFVLKIPSPATETSPPRLSSPTIHSIIASTARSASALVVPKIACTFSATSCLFIV